MFKMFSDETSQKLRAAITMDPIVLYFVDAFDRYIEHRIETDKVVIEILKDIQGHFARNDQMMEQMTEKFFPAAIKFIDENFEKEN